MTFALSGSIITQSGTDATLAGLSGIAGVTTFTQSGKTVYNIGDKLLNVSGTLTMDPRTEEIWTGTACPLGSGNGNGAAVVSVTGTFNIGVNITVNSVQAFPQSTALRINTQGGGYSVAVPGDAGGVTVASGGTLNWLYGAIYSWLGLAFGDGVNTASGTANVYSKSCLFVSFGANGASNENPQVRVLSTQTNILAMSTLGVGVISLLTNPASMSSLDTKHHAICGFGGSGSSPDAVYHTVKNYESGGGHLYDWGIWQGKWFRFTNAVKGSDFSMGRLSSAGTSNYGLLESRQAMTINAKNAAGAAITTGGWFLRDKNNGLRLAANALGNGKTNADYVSDRTYTATFNGAGSAAYSTNGGVLTHVAYRTYTYAATAADTPTQNKRDYRGETNANDDSFIARIRSYGLLFSELSVTLKGANGTLQNATLFANTAVVQSSATALAHTGITLTDHGGSPVAWNSKSWGITVTGNLSTNPALTAADIYHYLQYHLSQVGTTFNAKLGGEWHEMLKPAGVGYATETGTYSGLRTVKGVRVVDQSGNAFPGITYMTADDGTTYTPPVAVILTLSANVSLLGAEVRIYDLDNLPAGSLGTELGGTESCAGDTFQYTGSAGNSLWVQIMAPGYEEFGQSLVMPSTSAGFIATLQPDASA